MPNPRHRPAVVRPIPTSATANQPVPFPPPTADRITSTILLVDDDPAVREGLHRVLRTEGWNIITAASGEEALAYLQHHEPDLMITDLSMAAVTGWDLLFHESLQRPALPVFVITALPLTEVAGADRFAHEFFLKPVDCDALIEAVRRYIGAPRAASST